MNRILNPDVYEQTGINPLNAELHSICHLLALLGTRHILHVSGLRVKKKTPKSHHLKTFKSVEQTYEVPP